MISRKKRGSIRSVGKIALIRGNYSESNFGDDALLLATVQLLQPHFSTIVADQHVAYSDQRMSIRCAGKEKPVNPDVIVFGGGTQFFSFLGAADAIAPRGLGARILDRISDPASIKYWLQERRRLMTDARTPKVGLGLGVGPFPDIDPSREAAAKFLRSMALLWIRDAASESFCRENGVVKAFRSSDLCFTSAFRSVVRAPQISRARTAGEKRVAIVLRDWGSLEATFFSKMVEVARRLRLLGHQVEFFSFAPTDHCFRRALDEAGEAWIGWPLQSGDIEDYWKKLAQVDLVVSSRFHGAIFAILSETPFIPIEIEPKLTQLRHVCPVNCRSPIQPEDKVEEVIGKIALALQHLCERTTAAQFAKEGQVRAAAAGERALSRFFSGSIR